MPLTSNGESSHAPVNNGHKRKALHFLTCRRIQFDPIPQWNLSKP